MTQIAVLGYGTVGSGVVEVLKTNHESISKKAGQEINIKYVLDLRDFPEDPIQEKIVHDYNIILNDPEVKVVVEVMAAWSRHIPSVNRHSWQEKASAPPIRSWWPAMVPSF